MKNKPPKRRFAKKPAASLEPVNRTINAFRLRERSKDPNSFVHSRDEQEKRPLATGNEVSSRQFSFERLPDLSSRLESSAAAYN